MTDSARAGAAAAPEMSGSGGPATGKVLVTGAAGQIGRLVRAGLPASGWSLRLTDIADLGPAGPGEEVTYADLTDLDAVVELTRGVDAVVHLGGLAGEASYREIRSANIDGTYHVLEAARRCGVRRVVLASSNHAVGFTPRADPVGVGTRPRPDTFYGVSKVAKEALGSLYVDRYGLDVVCLRIGSQVPEPTLHRHLSTWLSDGDTVAMVQAALTAPAPGFAVLYGISANTRAWWDLEPGRALGYHPRDDAERYADVVAPPAATDDVVGGEFTGPEYDHPLADR